MADSRSDFPLDRLVITAASSTFGPALLALLGSMNLNWPCHPPVRVYDLGMDQETLNILNENQVEIVKVPPFCPHWRKHFTWKIWCLNDAPARHLLWIDAGIAILRPLDEIFIAIEGLGYFFVPNLHLLNEEASLAACRGCGVDPLFRMGKPTLAGGLMGFRKVGATHQVLREALRVALVEENIQATNPRHRHDQAILSLLIYKTIGDVVLGDHLIYAGYQSPEDVPGQKIWVHRRGILPEDISFFQKFISSSGAPRLPLNPRKNRPKNPFTLFLRFSRSRIRRFLNRLKPLQIYNGVRDDKRN